MKVFNVLESDVRSYCRSFPTVFTKAKGSYLYDREGKEFIDFLSGAGTLNYGHNHPVLKKKLIEYVESDGVVHGLDMASAAKEEFLKSFQANILTPRDMSYKIQFPGPTGTNAVEAAMKLARKVTGRNNIISFTNGFHGVTLGSVAATGNSFYREGAGTPLSGTDFIPYDGYFGDEVDTIAYARKLLEDKSSGVDLPAAMIVETVQGEGGVNCASKNWLRQLEKLCKNFDILLIVDDIQVGCGRTGTFFSFEEAGIRPDIIVLSKSLSGYGLPLSLVLMKPDLDQWDPGEHNGTFRGHNLAFVTARTAFETFWKDDTLTGEIKKKGEILFEGLTTLEKKYRETGMSVRGRGMIVAMDFQKDGDLATEISRQAFERGLIIETCGSEGHVVKCLPSLLISEDDLRKALGILDESIGAALGQSENAEKEADEAATVKK